VVSVLLVLMVLAITYKVWIPTRNETQLSGVKIIAYVACLIMISTWAIVYFPLIISSSYMPDEAWFLFTVATEDQGVGPLSWFDRYLAHPNAFGYGSLWWGLYSAIVDISSYFIHPSHSITSQGYGQIDYRLGLNDVIADGNAYLKTSILAMRSLAFSAVAVFMLALSRRSLIEPFTAIGVALLLSTPMMYWSGKVASPELFGVFLLLISVVKYIESKNAWWFILAGIACGSKLTCTPVAAIMVLCAMSYEWKRGGIKACLDIAVKLGAGCLLANLYLVTHPIEFVTALLKFSSLFPAAPWEMSFLEGPLPFWEGGTYGNLSYWYGSITCFAVAVIISIGANTRLGVALLLSALLMFVFMLAQPLHNWYWFTVLAASAIPVSFMNRKGIYSKCAVGVSLAALVVLNTYLSIDDIGSEIYNRNVQMAEHANYSSTIDCVESSERSEKTSVVYDMATIGMVLPLSNVAKNMNYPSSFSTLPGITDAGSRTDRLAVVGERSREIQPIREFLKRAEDGGAKKQWCGKALLIRF
jgi:hypothetical protein